MMEVVYVGPSDRRELEEEDFDKIGCKGHKALAFVRNIPQEVSNDCGEALLGHELVAGEFLGMPDFKVVQENTQSALDRREAEQRVNDVLEEHGEVPAPSLTVESGIQTAGRTPELDASGDEGDTAKKPKARTKKAE